MNAQPPLCFDPIDARHPLHFPCCADRRAIHNSTAPLASNAGSPIPGAGALPAVKSPAAGSSLPPSQGFPPVSLADGGSISSVLARRLSHLQHGHSVASDGGRMGFLLARARDELRFATEDLQLHPYAPDEAARIARQRQRRLAARKSLVKLAAYCLALIDAIDLLEPSDG